MGNQDTQSQRLYPVAPVILWRVTTGCMNAPFGWPGGKRNLTKTLLTLIPEHRAYVEVFSGSAKLLFAKERSHWEILNDINDDLMNFFRVAKHRPAELAEFMYSELIASVRFKELRNTAGGGCATRAELERAARFLYLTWYSFGSKGEHFASATIAQLKKGQPAPVRKSVKSIGAILNQAADRLRDVLIENRDFAVCIERYDSRGTFFYLDPPYSSFQRNGRYESLGERQAELFQLLARCKGKFLMSFDDCAAIRELARSHAFQVKPVTVTYTLGGAHRNKRAGELLISNYSK